MSRGAWVRTGVACGVLGCLAAGCADERTPQAAGDDGATDVGETGDGDGDGDGDAGETGDGDGDGDGDGGPPEPLCDALDVALVIDPAANAFDAGSREALARTLDTLVQDTGAPVRLLPNAGTEFMLTTDCFDGLGEAATPPVLLWGQEGQVLEGAHEALECTLDAIEAFEDPVGGDGGWMFSGLMFPILEQAEWPTPSELVPGDGERVGLAMLIGGTDDTLGGMYSRPGTTSAAYTERVADGDRRRSLTFTYGEEGDELKLFALTLGDTSRYADASEQSLADALDAWVPQAVLACASHDEKPEEEVPEGCSKIDLLFVVDGSASMNDEKMALRGVGGQPPVFKEFTDALLAELPGIEDFHVGVVSSEPGYTELHTHRLFPLEPESAETDCGLPPGQRWIVGPTDQLEEQFACLAETEAIDIIEETFHNAGLALENPANEGFLRDDSVLVVVSLTDEDTQALETRVERRQRILDAVGGRLDRVVVLSIAADMGTFTMPKTTCTGPYGKAVPGRVLTSLTFSFREQGVFKDICEGTLGDAFEDVLDDVVRTCEQYDPVP